MVTVMLLSMVVLHEASTGSIGWSIIGALLLMFLLSLDDK